MSGQWKPGDLAMVTWEEPSGRSTIESTERAEFTGAAWVWIGGMIQPEWVSAARPLVVIDPDDAEAVERLVSLYNRQFPISDGPEDAEAMADALREFANPTPPKPDEPQGLGAVVRDAEGVLWVRVARVPQEEWAPHDRNRPATAWAFVPAVEVLSEGVTS